MPPRSRLKHTFVYVVCGDEHAERVNVSLTFLKKFSRKDIVVLTSRLGQPINHDQVVVVPEEKGFDDHQMAIVLKTGIQRHLPDPRIRGCYLDNDVIAVNKDVDSVFTAVKAPFAFARDHYNLKTFSRYAVNCGCKQSQCTHLMEAIQKKFGVKVDDPEWFQWNGGVFVFSPQASPLLDLWDRYTRSIFKDPAWKVRDQGTLVAAAWKLGLQKNPVLPPTFNFIVDHYQGVPMRERDKAHKPLFNDTYSLDVKVKKPHPSFIHFINGGVMKKGWKNWDDVEKLLETPAPKMASAPAARPTGKPVKLDPSNRIVHGLWIGETLSKLELLTLHSFLKHGHEFHLWLYDKLKTPLPKGVVVRDASKIIPRERIIRKKDNDPETGVGKGSVSAPFSDLFRYKLLYEKGGYWVDMDVTCLKPFDFPTPYVFRTHRVGVVGSIMKCPPKSELMRLTYEQVAKEADENTPWLSPNRTLSRNVHALKLARYIRPHICNEDKWGDLVLPFIEQDTPLPEGWYGIHWINEMWRTLRASKGWYKGKPYILNVPSKDRVRPGTTLWKLYRQYGLADDSELQRQAPKEAVLLVGGPKVAAAPKPIPPPPLPAPKPVKLEASNKIVHGLWIGERLSNLELLTIRSLIANGHEFHLWLYGDLATALPREVVLEDANRILPREKILRKRTTDPETGVGRGSVASPFSKLFRFKLLYEKGGWWSDLDVACLRAFDVKGDYCFLSNGKGVSSSLLKCPPKSPLMKSVFETLQRRIEEDTPYSLPDAILLRQLRDRKLSKFIRAGFCNGDQGPKLLELVEKDLAIPKEWRALHWHNQFWRTLAADKGLFKGRRLVTKALSLERPSPSTTLGRLYEMHGLGKAPAVSAQAPAKAVLLPSLPTVSTAARQPFAPAIATPGHVNVLVTSLARGGAERSVLEMLDGLPERSTSNLFVLNHVQPAYSYPGSDRARVHHLGAMEMSQRLKKIALETLASPLPVVFTHLVHAKHLKALWAFGIRTIPVIQNSRPSWQDAPKAFQDPHVPWVAAVSEDVARQLREARCPKPVAAIRHELQRWFDVEGLKAYRHQVRSRHAIPDRTLLIGMVGEFKSQKAYTRAIRVLAEVKRHRPAKLMILGGWDHDWGHGRAAYVAACKLALELGVMPDLLAVGPVPDVAPYYAAFDVFLNTSVYEGLSVATLEAANAGCPIVSADAGGNREGLPEGAVLIPQSAGVDAYVSGIAQVLARGQRIVPVAPPDKDLIPRLWQWLGQYGVRENYIHPARKKGILFLADNLNLGGAPKSLVNLLVRLPKKDGAWLGLVHPSNHQAFLDELEKAGVPVFSTGPTSSYLDQAERILSMVQRLGFRTLVFWNLDARIKLLLAKVLPKGLVRLIDVSPGPWTFEDLDRALGLQKRLAFNSRDYFERLDVFVSKYEGGGPPKIPLTPGKLVVIPNGVAELAKGPAPKIPKTSDDLVIGTCCRILPNRRIEFFIEMLAELNRRLPGVEMFIVGAGNPKYADYWRKVQERIQALGVSNLRFPGQQADVLPYLKKFRVFVMLGGDHGCPNASLEAMSAGLPIVAAAQGGVSEQVEDGVNGFLVSDQNPKEMAHQVRLLLANPQICKAFGEASRRIAREKFSMERMVGRYRALFNPDVDDRRRKAGL